MEGCTHVEARVRPFYSFDFSLYVMTPFSFLFSRFDIFAPPPLPRLAKARRTVDDLPIPPPSRRRASWGWVNSIFPACHDQCPRHPAFFGCPGPCRARGMMLPSDAAYLVRHILVTNVYRTFLASKSESEVLGPPLRHPMAIVADAPPLPLTS